MEPCLSLDGFPVSTMLRIALGQSPKFPLPLQTLPLHLQNRPGSMMLPHGLECPRFSPCAFAGHSPTAGQAPW